MGLIVAGLCIWRCDFRKNAPIRTPSSETFDAFTVEFVMERQDVYGTTASEPQQWIDSDCKRWLREDSLLFKGHGLHPCYSGAPSQYQAIHVDARESSTTDDDTFFNWYPKPAKEDHLDFKFKRAMNKHIFDGNLNWNSRTIVMDLLLLLEIEIEPLDDKLMMEKKRAIIAKLFPVVMPAADFKYSELEKNSHPGLHIFFAYFWHPAFELFCKVFRKQSSEPSEKAAAIGEICHVLGITCRTQWMQLGFFHGYFQKDRHVKHFNSNKAYPSEMDNVEYLPCRCDRLLHLLHHRHVDCLKQFLQDIAEIYDLLKSRYLTQEVEIDPTKKLEEKQCANRTLIEGYNPLEGQSKREPKIAPNLLHPKSHYGCQNCSPCDLELSYLNRTEHYLLDDSLDANVKDRWCDDLRTKNVYLFALLDVS